MATTPIRDTDRFIVQRSSKNYWVDGDDFKDFVPPFEVGTCMAFWQAVAPMFWTRTDDASHEAPPGGKKTGFQHATARVISGAPNNTTAGSRTVQQVCNASIGIPLNNHTHTVKTSSHNHSSVTKSHGHGVTENSHSHGGSGGGAHGHTWTAGTGVSKGNGNPTIMNMIRPEPMTWSSVSGGSGTSGASGVGFKDNKGTMSFGCGNGSPSVSINHVTGSNVGNTLNFAVKYCDCILATKDTY
jgi:hypothetical protein